MGLVTGHRGLGRMWGAQGSPGRGEGSIPALCQTQFPRLQESGPSVQAVSYENSCHTGQGG